MTEAQNEEADFAGISLPSEQVARRLLGVDEANLQVIARAFDVQVNVQGAKLVVTGEDKNVMEAERALLALSQLAQSMPVLRPRDVVSAIAAIRFEPHIDLRSIFLDTVTETQRGQSVCPKGLGQKKYLDCMRTHDVTFALGPAGTGKTYLAMALAASLLRAEKVVRIILTRPAVEAGERIGFLPGDIEAKVNPYLRPLYDALHDLFGAEHVNDMIERQMIEVAPLAFMRGRTLRDAFVVLDEAQNTTREQMKMFLTRLGFGSKMVIVGDPTQTDLDKRQQNGLAEAVQVLRNVEGIGLVHLTEHDVVRHALVQRMIRAYEQQEM